MQHPCAAFDTIAGQTGIRVSGALCTPRYDRLPNHDVPGPVLPLGSSANRSVVRLFPACSSTADRPGITPVGHSFNRWSNEIDQVSRCVPRVCFCRDGEAKQDVFRCLRENALPVLFFHDMPQNIDGDRATGALVTRVSGPDRTRPGPAACARAGPTQPGAPSQVLR